MVFTRIFTMRSLQEERKKVLRKEKGAGKWETDR